MYVLRNKLFGGAGVIEKKPSPVFTFSEEYFGKELLSFFSSFFLDNGIDASFLRVENRVKHIHYFFPDESVVTATMKCKIEDIPIGNISICHPKQFVEEESLICTV